MTPPTLFLAALLLVVAASVAGPTERSAAATALGVSLVLAGLGLNIVASRHFERRGIAIRPGSRSANLATGGLFAASRNPMYLGMVLVLAGSSVALGTPIGLAVAVLFVPLMNRWFIRHEEVHLLAIFGDEYARYAERVRRWI